MKEQVDLQLPSSGPQQHKNQNNQRKTAGKKSKK
jgi:hypothetical protein